MASPTILALDRELHVTEPVRAFACDFLGYKYGRAFRAANAGEWPMTGPKGARRVIVPAALEQLGIPYRIKEAADDRS
jgi:hypothetical protein